MSFNIIAPYYDRLARLVFGRSLEQAQIALLGKLPTGGQWLMVGGGTGWLLEQVLERGNPEAVVFLEASGQMLRMARQRLINHPQRQRITFLEGTEANLSPTHSFDVILTPFVLDLFSESWLMEQMLPSLRQVLKPGGFWLVTDFIPTSVRWQKILVASMLVFFRLVAGLRQNRLPDWPRLMVNQQLQAVAAQMAIDGLILSVLFKTSP